MKLTNGSSDFIRSSTGRIWCIPPDISPPVLSNRIAPTIPLDNNSKWNFQTPELLDASTLLYFQKGEYIPDANNPQVIADLESQIIFPYSTLDSTSHQVTKRQAIAAGFTGGRNFDLSNGAGENQFTFEDDPRFFLDMNFGYKIPGYSEIDPSYNFYIPDYEELIQQDDFPEEVLPNMYVFSLMLNPNQTVVESNFDSTNFGSNSGLILDPNLLKFDKYITLDGNISLNQSPNGGFLNIIEGLALAYYFQVYKNSFDNVSIDFIETIKTKFSNVLNDLSTSEEFQRLYGTRYQYPMFIDLGFQVPDKFSDFLEKLREFYLLPKLFQDLIVDELKNINNSNSKMFFLDVNLNTFSPQNSNVNPFYVFDFTDWFNNFTGDIITPAPQTQPASNQAVEAQQAASNANEGLLGTPNQITNFGQNTPPVTSPSETFGNSPVPNRLPFGGIPDNNPSNLSTPNEITDFGQNVTTIDYDNILDIDDPQIDITNFLSRNEIFKLKQENFRTYEQIINGELAKSDTIGFKIKKFDKSNNLIQQFWLPNITGEEIIHFVDTQVKFNKIYKYTIDAFHLVYGTEYKYRKIKIDEPSIIDRIVSWRRNNSISNPGSVETPNNVPIGQARQQTTNLTDLQNIKKPI